MKKEYPVDVWFEKNVLVRHRVLMTLIVFWMAGLIFFWAPQYARAFEMSVIILWLIFTIPVVIGRIIWNYHHNPNYMRYCDRCGSDRCCVEEVDDEEEPQE